MLTIVTAGGERKSFLLREKITITQKKLRKRALILVPEQYTLETERSCSFAGEYLFSFCEILSFNRLPPAFAKVGDVPLPYLDSGGRYCFFRKPSAPSRRS
jgi:hypothetical protein